MLAELVQSCLETVGKLLVGSGSPVVQEINGGLPGRHVIVNRYDIQTVGSKRFQDRM